MKCIFILASCCAAGTMAYLNIDLLSTDFDTVLKARRSDRQLQLSSRSISEKRHQKRGVVVHSSEGPQDLTRGDEKTKKASGKQNNQQSEKAASQKPSQQQGNTGSQQKDRPKGKPSDPKPGPQSPRPPRSARDDIRAEVNFRGPGFMQWARGPDMLDQQVRRGDSRRRIATHSSFAAAGGVSMAEPPANAATQPISQHPIKAYAHGPVAGAAFIVPEGGRGHATADIQGRERQSWDIHGPENRAFSVNPIEAVPVRVHASVTHGGFVQASGSDGSDQGPPSPNPTR